MAPILADIPAEGPSTPASELLPTLQAIGGVFGRLVQVAPAAVSSDMAAVASYWNQVVADFQDGGTVGEVEAYIKAHPPAPAATINPAAQGLDNYLSATCHINVSS